MARGSTYAPWVRKPAGIRVGGRLLRVGVPILLTAVFAVWISAPPTQASSGAKAGGTNVLSLSGAVRARLVLSDHCLAFTLPALAAKSGAKTLGISVSAAASAHHYQLLNVIDENASSKADAQVSLATTKSFNLQFSSGDLKALNQSQMWEAGWWRVQAPGEPFTHYGTGTLTMTADGRAGTISATLEQVSGRRHTDLMLHGLWSCHTITHAP